MKGRGGKAMSRSPKYSWAGTCVFFSFVRALFLFIHHSSLFGGSTRRRLVPSASGLIDDEERNVTELAAGAQVLAFRREREGGRRGGKDAYGIRCMDRR